MTASAKPAVAGAPRDRAPATAAQLPDGTPHPDPFLARKGWQVRRGIYVRVPSKGRRRS